MAKLDSSKREQLHVNAAVCIQEGNFFNQTIWTYLLVDEFDGAIFVQLSLESEISV